ncbi:MAG: hypothetical protein MZW92_38140 [Comamonadaceae bacterium]|nr:hypothetical protein [Comamonadaceae bacterium]
MKLAEQALRDLNERPQYAGAGRAHAPGGGAGGGSARAGRRADAGGTAGARDRLPRTVARPRAAAAGSRAAEPERAHPGQT